MRLDGRKNRAEKFLCAIVEILELSLESLYVVYECQILEYKRVQEGKEAKKQRDTLLELSLRISDSEVACFVWMQEIVWSL